MPKGDAVTFRHATLTFAIDVNYHCLLLQLFICDRLLAENHIFKCVYIMLSIRLGRRSLAMFKRSTLVPIWWLGRRGGLNLPSESLEKVEDFDLLILFRLIIISVGF